MNLNRIIVVLVVLVAGIFVAQEGSFAAKPDKCSQWPECKDDGGKPPPPPTGCVDTYPGFLHGFLYTTEPKRKDPAELRLASFDGCRSALIGILPSLRDFAFHMTADGSKGVIVWPELGDNDIVRRLDFTVDESGELTLEQPVTILPLIGEEAPPDHNLLYWSMDIWGDETHASLYLTVLRQRSFGSDPIVVGDTRVAMIYDLNDLTDVTAAPAAPDTRVIYSEGAGDWQDAIGLDCSSPSVLFPQFVPTCYRAQGMIFNPSGTRLYFEDVIGLPDGQHWDTVLRIHIDMGGAQTLAEWTITGPELVYTGRNYEYWPHGTQLRPDSDPSLLPSPELIGMTYWKRRNSYPEFFHVFLNTDRCASEVLAPLSGGNLWGKPDLFMDCIDNRILSATTTSGSFQSADAIIFGRGQTKNADLFRRYVDGGKSGIEERLIENSNYADTGL